MIRSPCLTCTETGDRTQCSPSCTALQAYVAQLDRHDERPQQVQDARGCKALLRAVFDERAIELDAHETQRRDEKQQQALMAEAEAILERYRQAMAEKRNAGG